MAEVAWPLAGQRPPAAPPPDAPAQAIPEQDPPPEQSKKAAETFELLWLLAWKTDKCPEMLRNSKSTWQKNNMRCHVCIPQPPPKKKKTLHQKKDGKNQSPLYHHEDFSRSTCAAATWSTSISSPKVTTSNCRRRCGKAPVSDWPRQSSCRGQLYKNSSQLCFLISSTFWVESKQEKRSEKWWYGKFFKSVKEIKGFTDVGESRSWLDVDCHLHAFNELTEFHFALILFLLQPHVSLEN